MQLGRHQQSETHATMPSKGDQYEYIFCGSKGNSSTDTCKSGNLYSVFEHNEVSWAELTYDSGAHWLEATCRRSDRRRFFHPTMSFSVRVCLKILVPEQSRNACALWRALPGKNIAAVVIFIGRWLIVDSRGWPTPLGLDGLKVYKNVAAFQYLDF